MTVATPAARPGVLPAQRLLAHWPRLALAVIVVIAFAVRVVDVADNPPGFFTDEAAAGLDAHAILTSGKDMHGDTLPVFFRSLGDHKLPVFIYGLVPFVAVLGLSEFAVRFTVVVFGTLTVVTLYLLARELFRRDLPASWRSELPALVAAGVLAVLPWHVHYSRTGFGEMVSLPLFFTLAWWLFLRARRTGGSAIPAAIVFGLCFYTYRSGWVVLPPFLLVMAAFYARDLVQARRDTALAAAAFCVVLIPLVGHLVFGPSDRASQASIFNVESDQSTLSLFLDQYQSYFTTGFLFEDGDNGFITRHFLPGHGVLYWPLLPLVLAAIAATAWRPDRRGLLLVALLLLYPLGGALSDMSPISSRSILGAVTFSLLAGAGALGAVEAVAALRPRLASAAAFGVAGVVLIGGAVSAANYIDRYHDEYPRVSEDYWGWQGGPEEVLERFVARQDEYDELYLEGFFNAPHVFIPFYTGDDCPKCRIGDASRYDATKRQLFAFRVESPHLGTVVFDIHETLFYRNGLPAFVVGEIVAVR
jgi:4-amino-4-deoxy-L-arabinose transferase-like glycosyltransferase